MGKLHRADIEIEAPAERVWELLTDLEGYARWNPFTPRVECDRVVGHPVLLHVQMRPGKIRLQPETLLRWEPGVELRWGLIVHPWVFAGERWQRVEALGPGRCRYSTGERFVGAFAWVVDLFYGRAVERGFEAVAVGLRDACEQAEPGGAQ